MRTKLIYSKLTEKVLGCAIKAHRNLSSGFLEKIYEEALCLELTRTGLPFERQVRLTIKYLNQEVGIHRLDLVIEKMIVVELKAVKKFEDIHYATVLSYLRASRLPVTLLLNFDSPTLSIRRFANSITRLNAETQKSGNAEEVIGFVLFQKNWRSLPTQQTP